MYNLSRGNEYRYPFVIYYRSSVTMVTYSLSSFIPHTTNVLFPLLPHTMAAVTQTIVQNGRLGPYLLATDSHTITST